MQRMINENPLKIGIYPERGCSTMGDASYAASVETQIQSMCRKHSLGTAMGVGQPCTQFRNHHPNWATNIESQQRPWPTCRRWKQGKREHSTLLVETCNHCWHGLEDILPHYICLGSECSSEQTEYLTDSTGAFVNHSNVHVAIVEFCAQ